MSDFAYINTFIHIHSLRTVTNVNRRSFFHSQELNNGMLFEPHVCTTVHFNWR